MNKNLLIGLGGVGLVVVIGAGIFILKPFRQSPQLQQQTSTETAPQNEESSDIQNIRGTLKDLLTRNLPMECAFSQTDESVTTTGTVYLSGKKMRGNFETALPDGQQVSSFVIQDGKHGYTWTSQQEQGTKLKLDDSDMETKDEESSSIEDEDIDYTCKPWIVDNSFFIPPSNIEFVDISKQVQQIEKATEQVEKAQCSACDQLSSGQGRETCRQSLGCD